MENQNSSYSVQIGKTTFIVCVKQSETAKKPIEKMFKDMCRHEVTRDFLADNLMNAAKSKAAADLESQYFFDHPTARSSRVSCLSLKPLN